MKLSNETLNVVSYYFQGKGLESWSGWEREKEEILKELPMLSWYLNKELELEALALGVGYELELYTELQEEYSEA